MLIGEVVKNCCLTKDGVRYYESIGLIHSRPLQAGSRIYRDYDDDTLMRLALIEHGKSLGFTLKEGKPILDAIMNGTFTHEDEFNIAEKKIRELREKIVDIQQTINRLKESQKQLVENPKKSGFSMFLQQRNYFALNSAANNI